MNRHRYGWLLGLCLGATAAAEWNPVPAVRLREDFPGRVTLNETAELPKESAEEAATVADFIAAGLSDMAGRPVGNPLELFLDPALAPDAYELDLRKTPARLRAGSAGGWWNGAALFLDYARSDEATRNGAALSLPAVRVADAPDLRWRAIDFQWCYRPVEPEVMRRAVRTSRALRLNAIVPEFGPMVRWTTADSPMPLDEVCAFLAECARNGLVVIPKINCFGHADRGFPWPEKLGAGLDCRAEANYRALEREVRAWRDELAAAGLPMPYFHFGMDEASDCLARNVERYQVPAAELVAAHMNRVAELCREVGVTGIIYHDMLIGGDEPIYWRDMGTAHADRDRSYLARPQVNRSLAIDYWNYEGFDRYRTIEALKREGFPIFFTPWGGTSVRKMAKNAALYGEGLIGSTWCDFAPAPDGGIGGNSIYNQGWIRDGLVDVAEFGWNGAHAPDASRPGDGGAAWIDRWCDRASRVSDAQPIPLGDGDGEARVFKGVPFEIGTPLQLGAVPRPEYDRRFEQELRAAAWPLTLLADGKPAGEIEHFNAPASFRGLILYTASYGRETGVDIYSTEARIQDGRVWSKNDWGVGHTPIPRNGAVISGWGEANYGLPALPVGAKIALRDATGAQLPWQPADGVELHPAKAAIPLGRTIRRLHFLHRAAFEGDLTAPALVHATLVLEDGSRRERVFRYGRELAAPGDRLLVDSTDPAVWAARADADEVIYGYTWELPQAEKVSALRLELPDSADGAVGYELLALSAE